MTAVILAAGVASRLQPLTANTPKSLLPIGGKPLLQRSLETLDQCGIEKTIIVTGFLREMIEGFVASLRPATKVEFVHNPIFDSTNNNYSLWLAGTALKGEEMVLLDADVIFHAGILRRLLDNPHPDALVLRSEGRLGAEEIKVELDAGRYVLKIGKEIDPRTAAGESVGLEKFSAATTERLFDLLGRRKSIYEFYEASFQEMIDGGAKVAAVDSGGLPCLEIDTFEDLRAAEALAPCIE
ncbi:MAG: phosphocholine cytidylyltransferase family protein [Candidatus Aminicenantales bacterium]|jgi:choline kinase